MPLQYFPCENQPTTLRSQFLEYRISSREYSRIALFLFIAAITANPQSLRRDHFRRAKTSKISSKASVSPPGLKQSEAHPFKML